MSCKSGCEVEAKSPEDFNLFKYGSSGPTNSNSWASFFSKAGFGTPDPNGTPVAIPSMTAYPKDAVIAHSCYVITDLSASKTNQGIFIPVNTPGEFASFLGSTFVNPPVGSRIPAGATASPCPLSSPSVVPSSPPSEPTATPTPDPVPAPAKSVSPPVPLWTCPAVNPATWGSNDSIYYTEEGYLRLNSATPGGANQTQTLSTVAASTPGNPVTWTITCQNPTATCGSGWYFRSGHGGNGGHTHGAVIEECIYPEGLTNLNNNDGDASVASALACGTSAASSSFAHLLVPASDKIAAGTYTVSLPCAGGKTETTTFQIVHAPTPGEYAEVTDFIITADDIK